LDDADSANKWAGPIALRQVIAHLPVPVPPGHLKIALESAHEEVNARVALLGEADAAAPGAPTPGAAAPGGAAPSAISGTTSPWAPPRSRPSSSRS